jgi:hypothetical protein
VFTPRGPLPLRRMAAHSVVLAAAALTTLVAAAVGGALSGVPDELWSDPLGFVAGALPARPSTVPRAVCRPRCRS